MPKPIGDFWVGHPSGDETEDLRLPRGEAIRERFNSVSVLLAAWNATMGQPAYVTSSVFDILGTPAHTFRQWAVDHAAAFR